MSVDNIDYKKLGEEIALRLSNSQKNFWADNLVNIGVASSINFSLIGLTIYILFEIDSFINSLFSVDMSDDNFDLEDLETLKKDSLFAFKLLTYGFLSLVYIGFGFDLFKKYSVPILSTYNVGQLRFYFTSVGFGLLATSIAFFVNISYINNIQVLRVLGLIAVIAVILVINGIRNQN